MKTFVTTLALAATLATLALPSLADVLRGRIKEISVKTGVVTLLEGHKDYVFAANGDTKFLNVKGDALGGGIVSADLKAGRRVTANYVLKDGENVLSNLQLR